MKSKKWVLTILVIVIITSSLFAATPSKFDIGVLNYYKIQDIADTDFAAYSPGLRFEGHITPWFGLGLDGLLQTPFTGTSGVYNILATTDITFRVPVGFFEPYLALGPAYRLTVSDAGASLTADVIYSGRIGFDFNITPIFTVGVEGKVLLDHIPNIIDGTAIDWLDSTHVGLTLKAKF